MPAVHRRRMPAAMMTMELLGEWAWCLLHLRILTRPLVPAQWPEHLELGVFPGVVLALSSLLR